MGFAFAHHFASYDAADALTHYRSRFKPSRWRANPHGILAVAVVAAETDAEAEQLATSMDLNRLRRDRGQYLPLPSIEDALAYPYTDAERASIARNRSRLFVGSPATVMAKLQPMIAAGQPDELMIITAVYDHDARRKSYSLLADAFGLNSKAAADTHTKESEYCGPVIQMQFRLSSQKLPVPICWKNFLHFPRRKNHFFHSTRHSSARTHPTLPWRNRLYTSHSL